MVLRGNVLPDQAPPAQQGLGARLSEAGIGRSTRRRSPASAPTGFPWSRGPGPGPAPPEPPGGSPARAPGCRTSPVPGPPGSGSAGPPSSLWPHTVAPPGPCPGPGRPGEWGGCRSPGPFPHSRTRLSPGGRPPSPAHGGRWPRPPPGSSPGAGPPPAGRSAPGAHFLSRPAPRRKLNQKVKPTAAPPTMFPRVTGSGSPRCTGPRSGCPGPRRRPGQDPRRRGHSWRTGPACSRSCRRWSG